MTIETGGEIEQVRLFWQMLDAATLVWRDRVRPDGKGEQIRAVWRRKFGEPMPEPIGRSEWGDLLVLWFPKGRVFVTEPHRLSLHVVPGLSTWDNPATALESALKNIGQKFFKPKW